MFFVSLMQNNQFTTIYKRASANKLDGEEATKLENCHSSNSLEEREGDSEPSLLLDCSELEEELVLSLSESLSSSLSELEVSVNISAGLKSWRTETTFPNQGRAKVKIMSEGICSGRLAPALGFIIAQQMAAAKEAPTWSAVGPTKPKRWVISLQSSCVVFTSSCEPIHQPPKSWPK